MSGLHASPVVLAIDLGGTRLRLALVAADGGITAGVERPSAAGDGPAAIVAQIAVMAAGLRASHPAPLLAAGLATPGIVDAGRGVVVAARNLAGWQDVPIVTLLAPALGVPVVVENDVNAAAVGEAAAGAGRGQESIVFVAAGTGVGAGIVTHGRLHRGAHGAAGEIGSLPSGCAEPGFASLEDLAAGPGIVRRARHHGFTAAGAPAVFDAARAGVAAAQQAIADAAAALAVGVVALIAAVDPGVIVIGGGLSEQGETLLAPLRAAVARRYPLRAPLVTAELGAAAQLHGAAVLAWGAVRPADSDWPGGHQPAPI